MIQCADLEKMENVINKSMKDIRTIIRELGRVVLDGVKVPHTVSNPVLRKENGK